MLSFFDGRIEEYEKFEASLNNIKKNISFVSEFAKNDLYNEYIQLTDAEIAEMLGMKKVRIVEEETNKEYTTISYNNEWLPEFSKKITPYNWSTVKNDRTLERDIEVYGDVNIKSGTINLNGHSLTIYGNLTQEEGTIYVNKGHLIVNGDYRIQSKYIDEATREEKFGSAYGASLTMKNVEDYVLVNGDFITTSYKYSNGDPYGISVLSAGTMEIKGNFSQMGPAADSFNATNKHIVVLSGENVQNIFFQSYPYSHFNNLTLTKPKDTGYIFNPDPCWTGTLTEPNVDEDYEFDCWKWNGYKSAIAIFKNSNNKTQNVDAVITSNRTEPTCEADGKIVYTATAVFNDKSYTDNQTEVLSKIGHSYKLTNWDWTEYTSAKATFTCENDKSHVKTVETTNIKLSIDSKGNIVYTAIVKFDGTEYIDTKIKTKEDSDTDTDKLTDTDKYTDTDKPVTTDTDKSTDTDTNKDINIVNDDFTCKVLSDKTAAITSFNGKSKKITIPNSINGVKVTKISAKAFKNCLQLEIVIISDNITEIGENAFEGCKNLEEIIVPDSVTSISVSSFRNCNKLKLFASKGSYGEKFASQNNITFININSQFGDLDDDEKITSADSLLILRQSVSLEHFTDSQQFFADVDGDGKITSADALEVLRYSVSLPTTGNIGKTITK